MVTCFAVSSCCSVFAEREDCDLAQTIMILSMLSCCNVYFMFQLPESAGNVRTIAVHGQDLLVGTTNNCILETNLTGGRWNVLVQVSNSTRGFWFLFRPKGRKSLKSTYFRLAGTLEGFVCPGGLSRQQVFCHCWTRQTGHQMGPSESQTALDDDHLCASVVLLKTLGKKGIACLLLWLETSPSDLFSQNQQGQDHKATATDEVSNWKMLCVWFFFSGISHISGSRSEKWDGRHRNSCRYVQCPGCAERWTSVLIPGDSDRNRLHAVLSRYTPFLVVRSQT